MAVLFPRWLNALPTLGAIGGLGGAVAAVTGVWYWFGPDFWEVGYMPTQPGSGFNHQLHAGKLGIDCRYCHTHVEHSPEANVPAVSTCMGCHAEGRLSAEVETRIGAKVQFVRTAYEAGKRFDEVALLRAQGKAQEADELFASYAEQGLAVVEGGESIPWRRVHKLPDYVRNFPHHVHVAAGVSCYSCHGQIAGMPVVFQAKSLSMGWCLECHRKVTGLGMQTMSPQTQLVPKDKVTFLKWVEDEWFANSQANTELARAIAAELADQPPENCGACHY